MTLSFFGTLICNLLERFSRMLCVVNNLRIGEMTLIVLLSSVVEASSVKQLFLLDFIDDMPLSTCAHKQFSHFSKL